MRMAAFATAVRGLVAPGLADLARSAPELELTLVERDPADAVELVVSGQVDLAVVHNWVGVPLHLPAGLDMRPVGEDVADVLVHRSHPLAGASSLTPEQLVGERWAVTPAGTICHAWFVHMFAGFSQAPTVRYWTPDFSSQVALVEATTAVALVPRLGRGVLPDAVVAVAVHDPVPTRQVLVVTRSTMASSPALRHISDLLVTSARARVGTRTSLTRVV